MQQLRLYRLSSVQIGGSFVESHLLEIVGAERGASALPESPCTLCCCLVAVNQGAHLAEGGVHAVPVLWRKKVTVGLFCV